MSNFQLRLFEAALDAHSGMMDIGDEDLGAGVASGVLLFKSSLTRLAGDPLVGEVVDIPADQTVI